MNVGEKIRYLREQNNMTMEDLAKELGVQRSAVNKYEKGIVVNLKRSTILSLCRVFSVPPSCFIDDEDDSTDLTDDELRLIRLYRGAEPSAQQIAVETLANHQKKDTLSKAE